MGCLSRGASGSGVAEVIVALQQVGLFSQTAIVGQAYYDATVENAVGSYQSYHGIPVDGVVGPQTAAVMGVDPAYLTGPCPSGAGGTAPTHDYADTGVDDPSTVHPGVPSSGGTKSSSSIGLLALVAAAIAWKMS
jgi:peptidoglycan hydrolase-like protein with peptidoglycan-binding domain